MAKQTIAVAFGKNLQKQRKAKGLSQEALAEKAQVHPTYIGLVERGLRNPSLNNAAAIAKALGFSLAQFVAQSEKLQRND